MLDVSYVFCENMELRASEHEAQESPTQCVQLIVSAICVSSILFTVHILSQFICTPHFIDPFRIQRRQTCLFSQKRGSLYVIVTFVTSSRVYVNCQQVVTASL
jgi:hypothetical protein